MPRVTDITLLTLDPILVPPYSARNIVQTLNPIEESNIQTYTIVGKRINLALPTMKRYYSLIACTDFTEPALSGVWPGMVLTVGCASWLRHRFGEIAEKPEVPGSKEIIVEEGIQWEYYRPLLPMMVGAWRHDHTVRMTEHAWELELFETIL